MIFFVKECTLVDNQQEAGLTRGNESATINDSLELIQQEENNLRSLKITANKYKKNIPTILSLLFISSISLSEIETRKSNTICGNFLLFKPH